MLNFTFSEDISKRLEKAVAGLVDLSPLMGAIADVMRSGVVASFETEIDPDGVRWKPSQRAIEQGGKTLTDRGHLRDSIVAVSDDRSAIVGTNLIYAAIHQFGGKITPKASRALRTPAGPRGAVNMPARPFLGFSPETVANIEDVTGSYLLQVLGGAA